MNPINRRQFTQHSAALTTAAAMNPMLLSAAEPSGKKVRIGVVGGNFGLSFFWNVHPNSTVTAVCDVRPERLEALSAKYECDTTYTNFHDLIHDRTVDAVAVFTPAPLHAYMACEAMKAGKHVVSAVPAAMALDECEELIECVKETGMIYMMAETSFFRYQIIQCRKWSQEQKFGEIFHAEAEYLHDGLIDLMHDENGQPNWRHGFPPMHYITHCTGAILPVTGERLTEVTCTGWGDGHQVLQTNLYQNPFWNETAFFKTSGGHTVRIAVWWRVAEGGVERASFYGDKMSYHMPRPGNVPGISSKLDPTLQIEAVETPDFWDVMPEAMRVRTPHGGAHTWITHEFVTAVMHQRRPGVDVYEAVAYTAPGIFAHQSALEGGAAKQIKDFGRA